MSDIKNRRTSAPGPNSPYPSIAYSLSLNNPKESCLGWRPSIFCFEPFTGICHRVIKTLRRGTLVFPVFQRGTPNIGFDDMVLCLFNYPFLKRKLLSIMEYGRYRNNGRNACPRADSDAPSVHASHPTVHPRWEFCLPLNGRTSFSCVHMYSYGSNNPPSTMISLLN